LRRKKKKKGKKKKRKRKKKKRKTTPRGILGEFVKLERTGFTCWDD
jgi:hypothetical protein